jgi:TPR repeat protein
LAAEQGNATSQYILADMYADGRGVPRDYIQAYMWFSLAGASGDADGIKKRDIVAGQMTAEQTAEAQRLAREWKPKTRTPR